MDFIGSLNQIFRPNTFEVIFANNNDKYATETYNANFGPDCVQRDINSLVNDPDFEIPQADIVIGGPPCQGFSLLNKKRANDERRYL